MIRPDLKQLRLLPSNSPHNRLPYDFPDPEPKSSNAWWRSPITLLCGTVGLGIIGFPLWQDAHSPRLISSLYVDVSSSNQEFRKQMELLCQARLEYLQEGDIRIDAKFADRVLVEANGNHDRRDLLLLQKDCQKIANAPANLGTRKGTSLPLAIASLEQEVQHQRVQGKNNRLVATFVIQQAEPGPNQPPLDFEQLRNRVVKLVSDGSILIFIGSDIELQQPLKEAFRDLKNVEICTYESGKRCLEDALKTARQLTR